MPLLRFVMTARVNEDVLSGKIVTLQSCSFPVYLCACREKCEHLDDAGRHPGPAHTQSLGAGSTAGTWCGLKKKKYENLGPGNR